MKQIIVLILLFLLLLSAINASLTKAAEDEEDVKSEMIGATIVNFLLGKRDVAEKENSDNVKDEESQEETTKEQNEETRVLINGYDVTETITGEITEKEGSETEQITAKKEERVFRKIISWIFG